MNDIEKARLEGQAKAFKVAADLLHKVSNHKGRVVGTNKIRDIVTAFRELAVEFETKSKGE